MSGDLTSNLDVVFQYLLFLFFFLIFLVLQGSGGNCGSDSVGF